MIRIVISLTLFLLSLITFAQVSENRTVSSFSQLKVSQGIELYYSQNSSQSIKVETDDNEKLNYIKTEVEGETLRVHIVTNDNVDDNSKRKNKNYNNNIHFKTLKVYVSAPEVTDFTASSSASIKVESKITSKDIHLKASSSGSISGDFKCDNATIELSSSGKLTSEITTDKLSLKTSSSAEANLSGASNDAIIKASSSSECKAKNLVVNNANIDASSSATINITVKNNLNADASSSADIYYYGNPTNVLVDKSSSGEVIKR